MSNIRPFQIILLAVFVLLAFVALFLVRTFNPPEDPTAAQYGSRVLVWGSLPAEAFYNVFSTIADENKSFDVVEYVDIDERRFEDTLVNAIAEGRSPDLVVLPHDQLVRLRSKLVPVPYETFSEREFKNQFVDGAEIFARSEGVYALPLAVDPLVLYWNRDLFASNGLAQAPTTWELMVSSVVPTLTVRDNSRTILQSALAFGEYRNVRNADAVLAMLLLQSGSRMIEEGDRGYVVALNEAQTQGGQPPMEAAVRFYTDFSNANSPAYTWNRAQPEDRSAFVAGDLATYFGFGSEVLEISERNPNLNFDVAPVPQGAGATTKRDYGRFYGLAIPRASGNVNGAYAAARTMTNPTNAALLANELNLAPVARATIAAGSNNAFSQVIYESALIARGWLDPNPPATADILQTMIEDIVSNRVRISSAVADAVNRITLSF